MTDRSRAEPDLARGEARTRRTGRWRGVETLALVGLVGAILVGSAAVMLTGLAGVGFAAYGRLRSAPEAELAVDRHVDETTPSPGERVGVTLTVRNESGRLLPDLRLCDDVPPGLRVVEGTPRHTTALRPGKEATVSYEVEAVRGAHAFDSLTVITRDLSGASERVQRRATATTTVTCHPHYGERDQSLRDRPTLLPGRHPVSATGEGIAFHSLREYRRGDSLSRIDWNRLAKGGQLAARQFDQPRTPRVVVLVDARRAAYASRDGDRRPAVDVAAHAAGELAAGLLDGGALVGLATLSPRECWIPPGGGSDHRDRLLDAVTTHPSLGWSPPAAAEARDLLERVLARLPGDAQVVFCSPLLDDGAEDVARQLDARGHDVTLLSPAVTGVETPTRQLAAVERRHRLDALRRAGLPLVELCQPESDSSGGWTPCRWATPTCRDDCD